MSQVENGAKAAMQAAIDHLKQELKALRTGRANVGMFDKVIVEAYGSQLKLKELANLSTPEPRQIIINPFDFSTAGAIKKGIELANLGVNPIIDGKVIRINIPPMDEALRKQIAKQCRDLGEKSKITIRDIRRKYNQVVHKQKADGEIPEDMMKKLEKSIQDLTDKFCKEIDGVISEKEKEVMTI